MRDIKVWLIMGILLIGLVGAEVESLGSQQINEKVELKQIGADFISCNITSVSFPNSSVLIKDVTMTKRENEYNYTLNNQNVTILGTYIVNGFCTNGTDDIVWAYDFEATYTGEILNTERSILYIGLIALLVFMFLLIVFNVSKLPASDHVTEDGIILGVNNLKYFRPVLWAVAWGILLAIVFLTSNIALAYLPSTMFGTLFFNIYRVMFVITLPAIVVWFLYMFAKIWRDREMKRLMERGVEMKQQW